MTTDILTPLAIWKDFDFSLSLDTRILSSETEDGIRTDKVRFKGRAKNGGRVDIFAVYMCAVSAEAAPAVLLLNDADKTVDPQLMRYVLSLGYSVLMPDYRGVFTGEEGEECTVYPEDVSYANTREAGRHLLFADEGIERTCWFEWTCVAKYAVEFLKRETGVSRIGAMGIRAGGELIWKLLLFDDLACGITVNAAGWLAYRGTSRFAEQREIGFDEERYRFVCGVDSQSYAPFIKKPVLMLCTSHDEGFDLDRAYDTFSRIGENVESAISYSVEHRGFIGKTGQRDIELFFRKHLGGRQVFIPRSVDVDICWDADGGLVAVVRFDAQSAIERCGVFCAENTMNPVDREWTAMPHKRTQADGSEIFALNICEDTRRVFVYAYANCTNGFTTTGRIIYREIDHSPANAVKKSRVLYSGREGINGFYVADSRAAGIAECFASDSADCLPEVKTGYGGIAGIYSKDGLMTYRVSMEKYSPDENSMLVFDAYSYRSCVLTASVVKRINGVLNTFFVCFPIEEEGKWKKIVKNAADFKDRNGVPLDSFRGCISLQFDCSEEKPYIVNNIVWI